MTKATPAPKRSAVQTSNRILDAATECFTERGVSATSMSAIAERAGVSRVSLYRHFPSRDEVLNAVAMREAMRMVQSLPPLTDLRSGGAELFAAAFANAVVFLRNHELLQTLLREEPALVLELAKGRADQIAVVMAVLTPILQVQLGLPHQRAMRLAEVALRLLFSFVVLPSFGETLDDPAEIQAFVADSFRLMVGEES